MAEEQTAFIAVLPRLVEALMSGDANGDGVRDFRPVESLHIGAISVDLGAGPHTGVPTCREGLGEDAVLRSVESPSRDCPPHPSGIFEFGADEGSSELGALRCVTNVGIRQCGFEQQLEATLKALTPSAPNAATRAGYTPPRFMSAAGVPDAVPGHADGINGGFVRDDSVLAILLLTDEEDCSVSDYGLFVTGDPRFMSTPLNLRCYTYGAPGGVVRGIERYVEGLVGLRRDPRRLVFSGIVGIPPGLEVAAGASPDYGSILGHPDMVPRENAMGTNLVPSCVTMNGVAYPPIRIVQTAAGLSASGAQVSLSSICADDFRPAIGSIAWRIGAAIGP